jgi:8-oxo-dGTP diphosphatase
MSERERLAPSSACSLSAPEHRPPRRRQPHPYAAVDVVVFAVGRADLKTLLVQIARGPLAGAWAFPGGFVGLDESPDAAAAREVRDHTGIGDVYLEQLYTFGGPDRDPVSRVVSVAYIGLTRDAERPPRLSAKYAVARWCAVRALPALAYDHARIAHLALARLRAKLEYTNIVYNLLPRAFTLTELQHAYEAILARRLDRRNFRRKLLTLGLLRRLPGARRGSHRPAALYGFRQRSPMIISIL